MSLLHVAGSPVLNVKVRVRTGSRIGIFAGSLAIAYCELNPNTHSELFISSWNVNNCAHNF